MNRSTIDLWVGIFVALGLGAILFLSLKVGNLLTTSHAEGYRIEAAFDNIGGLKVRAPVKAAGVAVGLSRLTPASASAANHSAAKVSPDDTTIAPIAAALARNAENTCARRGRAPASAAAAP